MKPRCNHIVFSWLISDKVFDEKSNRSVFRDIILLKPMKLVVKSQLKFLNRPKKGSDLDISYATILEKLQ